MKAKVAVITGAASGIGLALSQACLQKGSIVIMADKNEKALTQEAERLSTLFDKQVFSIACDVCKIEDLERLLHFVIVSANRVDWIYNNAGIMGELTPLWELDIDHAYKVMDVNVFAMIKLIKIFMPYLFSQPFPSRIINIASLYAVCSGSQLASYTMSKHAVLALSESLYFDLKRLEKPVEVSIAFPSFTDTALLSSRSDQDKSSFHHTLNGLLAHSRPALEVAEDIVKQVEDHQFYILPDKEVIHFCEQRSRSIVLQSEPHKNDIERLLQALMQRQKARGL